MKDKPKDIYQEPIVKFVRKANKFCRTFFEHDVQKQEWFDKPCDIDADELCKHPAIHGEECLSCQKVRELLK